MAEMSDLLSWTTCSRAATSPAISRTMKNVVAIRSLNDAIAADPRVKVVLIPIGDGVSFVQKVGVRQ